MLGSFCCCCFDMWALQDNCEPFPRFSGCSQSADLHVWGCAVLFQSSRPQVQITPRGGHRNLSPYSDAFMPLLALTSAKRAHNDEPAIIILLRESDNNTFHSFDGLHCGSLSNPQPVAGCMQRKHQILAS